MPSVQCAVAMAGTHIWPASATRMSLHTLRKRKTAGQHEELQEKPFACGICKKAFQHWESLKRHCKQFSGCLHAEYIRLNAATQAQPTTTRAHGDIHHKCEHLDRSGEDAGLNAHELQDLPVAKHAECDESSAPAPASDAQPCNPSPDRPVGQHGDHGPLCQADIESLGAATQQHGKIWQPPASGHSSQAQASTANLTFTQAVLLPAVVGLSGRDKALLWKGLCDTRFDVKDFTARWPTAGAYTTEMDELQVYEEVSIYSNTARRSFALFVRKDIRALFQELYNKLGENADLRPGVITVDGTRRIHGFNSADWLQRQQASTEEGAVVLAYALHSDKTHVGKKKTRAVHPFNVFPLQGGIQLTRKPSSVCRLAFAPVVRPRDLGIPDSLDQRTSKQKELLAQVTYEVLQLSTQRLLASLKDICVRGMELRMIGGDVCKAHPRPAVWTTDIQEKNAIALIQQTFDIRLDCAIKQAIQGCTRRRREGDMRKVIAEARRLLKQGQKRESDDMLDEHGLSVCQLTAGAGFGGGVDIYELLGHPDRLHQTNKGIMDHMLRQVRGQLATAEAALVDRELYRVPDYPGLSLPTGGFAGMQSTASELRALFVCALVPLTAAHGQAAAIAFIRSMAALLEWEALRDASHHTEESLEAMDTAAKRFIASLPSTRVWDFPKMAGILAYAHTIRELGSAAVASTGYGEAAHKAIKPWINRTNGHHKTFLGQTVREHARNTTALDLAAAYWDSQSAEDETVLRGLAQRASSLGRAVPGKATLRAWYLAEPAPHNAQGLPALAAAFPSQAELTHFATAFHCFLAEHDGDIPLSASAVGHPTDDGQVGIFPAIGLPHALHREDELGACVLHVCPAFGSSKRPMYPDVAIRGPGERELWFGQMRLLFTFTRGGQQYHAAFIRWYEAVPSGAQKQAGQTGPVAARSATQMLRLKWARVRVGGLSQDWYGCVFIASILRPALIQPDPTSREHFFYNHFMR